MTNLDPFRISSNQTPLDLPQSEASRWISFRRIVRRAFWSIAGKDPDIVEACSAGTQMRATATGIYMVTVIPILAFVAMFQFLKPLDLGVAGVAGATVWAIVMPLLDRLVLLFQTGATVAAKWIKAGFRFAGTIIMGLLVTEALIIMFFASTIDRAMRQRIDTEVSQATTQAREENAEQMNVLTAERKLLQDRLESFRSARDEADRLRHAEADGELGHARGEGIHHARRKEAWERAAAEYEVERGLIEPKILQIEQDIRKIEESAQTKIGLVQDAEERSRDFLSKHQALFAIVFSSPSAFLMYGLMFLGISLLESAPLLQKVISDEDEYDRRAAREESDREAENQLFAEMSRDTVVLRRTLWGRVVTFIRDGRPMLPKTEERLGDRVHGALIAKLLEQLFGEPEEEKGTASIRFSVMGHFGNELFVQLPGSVAATATLNDFADEIEKVAAQLPRSGQIPQQFVKAETTLGREIWVHEPLYGQLESDHSVVLFFGHPLDYGVQA